MTRPQCKTFKKIIVNNHRLRRWLLTSTTWVDCLFSFVLWYIFWSFLRPLPLCSRNIPVPKSAVLNTASSDPETPEKASPNCSLWFVSSLPLVNISVAPISTHARDLPLLCLGRSRSPSYRTLRWSSLAIASWVSLPSPRTDISGRIRNDTWLRILCADFFDSACSLRHSTTNFVGGIYIVWGLRPHAPPPTKVGGLALLFNDPIVFLKTKFNLLHCNQLFIRRHWEVIDNKFLLMYNLPFRWNPRHQHGLTQMYVPTLAHSQHLRLPF